MANLKSDPLDKNSTIITFYQYLTNSNLHQENEIELYSIFESSQITKNDLIDKIKETSY